MRIKILRATVIHGHDGAQVGDIIEVSPEVGGELVALRRAEEVRELKPEPVQTREPVVEHRDPTIEVVGMETIGGTVRPKRSRLRKLN